MKPVVIIAKWGRATVQPTKGETIVETVNNFIMDTEWCPSDFGTNIIVDTDDGVKEFMFYRPVSRKNGDWNTLEVIHATKN
jgi:hypothetical protein